MQREVELTVECVGPPPVWTPAALRELARIATNHDRRQREAKQQTAA